MLVSAGEGIAGLGAFGTFLYGFLLHLSGAVGLHHMIYPMFWYSPLGGTEVVDGQSVSGAKAIFFAQLADPTHQGLCTEGTKYFAGRFDTPMFGLPGACLAMYHCVPKGRRKKFAGLFLGVALTSFITGITEPIEYMFLFVAPLLYVCHAFLDGLSFLIADLLQSASETRSPAAFRRSPHRLRTHGIPTVNEEAFARMLEGGVLPGSSAVR